MTITTEQAQRMRTAAKQSASAHRHLVGMEVATESFDFIQLATPVNVLALLDALEAKDKLVAELREHVTSLEKRLKETERALVHASDRAQEMEARTEQQPVMYQYREHNPTNGMKTAWETVDAEMYTLLTADTDPETAEFRPLFTNEPAAQPVTVKLPDELTIGECNSDRDISYAHGWNMAISQCEKEFTSALHAAGIKIAESE